MPFSAWRKMSAPAGRKFATSVGRPMPRFTVMPSRSSWATRMAMSSLVKPADVMSRPLHNALHVNPRRHDVLRVQRPGRYDLLGLRDCDARRCRHDRVEVAPRLAIDEVAQRV